MATDTERRAGPAECRKVLWQSPARYITEAGRKAFAGKVGAKHEVALCASLSADERVTLASLLQRIADEQGLTRGVHPGYRNLNGSSGKR